jgi:hypothetical protein
MEKETFQMWWEEKPEDAAVCYKEGGGIVTTFHISPSTPHPGDFDLQVYGTLPKSNFTYLGSELDR